MKKRKGNEGYNVATGEYTDLVKAGVVDPTKVTELRCRTLLQFRVCCFTTEALVTELPEKRKRGSSCGGMPAWANDY